ncbi:unnamed protein product [Linum trigynum]
MFTFPTTASVVQGYGASPKYCRGDVVTEYDVATYSAYVAHVLSELATVTPTVSGFQYGTVFPNDNPGSVQGTALCDGTRDASRCATCLSGLQKLLYDSCSSYEGAGAKGGIICGMGFDIVA